MNPRRGVGLARRAAAASVAAIPDSGATVPWLPSWTEDTTFSIADVVSLVLWVHDPLYRAAAPAVRRAMEMEEAAELLHSSETRWKELDGRTRGWVRKHLEEDLRARAAGAEPAPDAWELVRTVKRAAQLADYVCLSRGVRVGLWWPEQKVCTMIPFAGTGSSSGAPVVQLSCLSGRILLNKTGDYRVPAASWPALVTGPGAAASFTWAPPLCAPAIGAQTVAQIIEKMDALQAGLPRTGGRAALWTRYLWARLTHDLAQ